MDLSIKSESWGMDDQSWRMSRYGLDTARSITLDVAAFTQADHYPDGFLLSGIPLAKGADGLYGPYAAGGTLDGHLLGNVHVLSARNPELPDVVGGALQWQAVVDVRFLPGGADAIDAAAMESVAGRIRYENVPAAGTEGGA